MKIEGPGELLRIFIGESDQWHGRPLHEAIMLAAREQGLAGCTVVRGVAGFGAQSHIHTVKLLRLSEDLPMVIEIVDKPERIAAFLPKLDEMVADGMVTLEKVNVLIYRHNAGDAAK
ncbi:MAG: DUF190 domain-containing protein [Pirellulales bacterium]